MADNSQINNGTGDVIRGKDRGPVKTQVVGLDLGIGTDTEQLMVPRADGFLRNAMDPTTYVYDTFEILDTANTWTTGGTVAPTGTSGNVAFNVGTTASARSFMRTQAVFQPGSSAFLQFAGIVQLAAAAQTGNARWWGLGIPAATPTVTVPLTNGTVFEVDSATGALFGRTYSNSVKTQEIALTRPTDGGWHRYQILYRASRAYFNIDGVEVGSIPFPNSQVSALPLTAGSVNGGTALGTAVTFSVSLLGVGDTARQGVHISDSKYPWREVQVRANGALDVNIVTPSTASTPAYVTGTAIVATTTNLVPAPGAGLSIYVTDMEGSNEGAAGTRISLLEGTTVKYARFMAASGGGFVTNLGTPWKLPANTALNYGSSVATTFHLTVNYYVAP